MTKPVLSNKLSDADIYNLNTQQREVYDYLITGRRLTRMIALNTMGIQEVTTRLSELRKKGLDIKSEFKRDFGGTRYKSYWVEVEATTNG